MYDFITSKYWSASTIEDISDRLVTYQAVSFMLEHLNRHHLQFVQQQYDIATSEVNAAIAKLFASYDYVISHTLQRRQSNIYSVDIMFKSKESNIAGAQPTLTASFSVDNDANLFDAVIAFKHMHNTISLNNEDEWYNSKDCMCMQRLLMKRIENYNDDFKQIVKQIIINRTAFAQQHEYAQRRIASILEDNSNEIFKLMQQIAQPIENYTLYGINLRPDNEPGFAVYKYRVSNEKIYNINVDASLILLDNDGEVTHPETFLRFESIKKRDLPEYMQQRLAFITADEYANRIDADNMFIWLSAVNS
jgi:hypothetical protein